MKDGLRTGSWISKHNQGYLEDVPKLFKADLDHAATMRIDPYYIGGYCVSLVIADTPLYKHVICWDVKNGFALRHEEITFTGVQELWDEPIKHIKETRYYSKSNW